MSAPRSQRFPLRILPDRCLPALSLLPGQRPAQLARCPAVGNTPMSTPISAMRTSAVRLFTPGIVSRRLTSSAKGAITSSRLSGLVIVLTLPVNEEEGHLPYLYQSAYPAKGTTVGGRTDDPRRERTRDALARH